MAPFMCGLWESSWLPHDRGSHGRSIVSAVNATWHCGPSSTKTGFFAPAKVKGRSLRPQREEYHEQVRDITTRLC